MGPHVAYHARASRSRGPESGVPFSTQDTAPRVATYLVGQSPGHCAGFCMVATLTTEMAPVVVHFALPTLILDAAMAIVLESTNFHTLRIKARGVLERVAWEQGRCRSLVLDACAALATGPSLPIAVVASIFGLEGFPVPIGEYWPVAVHLA